ncbi:MAG: hypothetical protein FWG87_12860 [Defluviitaleaceae bacterium]|nr:hypothetical protein [Defluviitaleaceae bacterium]
MVEVLTFRERWENDAEVRGEVRSEAIGKAIGVINTADKALELLEGGANPMDVAILLRKMKSEYSEQRALSLH